MKAGKIMAGRFAAWRNDAAIRYARLEPREQRVLLAAGILLPLIVYVFVFLLPMQDDITALQRRLPVLKVQLQQAKQLASQLQRRGGKKAQTGDLTHLVEVLASSSNIRPYITRLKPEDAENGATGQHLLVSMRKAPYPELVGFLAAVAGRRVGIEHAKLTVVADGVLDVELGLASD